MTVTTSTTRVALFDREGIVVAHALIDSDDAADVMAHRWFVRPGGGYAARVSHCRGKQTLTYMHRQLLGLERGDPRRVDHINHDGLDNRRCNLRIVNHFQNSANMRGHLNKPYYRGVHFDKRKNKWAVECMIAGYRLHLGTYADPLVAEQVSSAIHRGLLRLPEAALVDMMAKCEIAKESAGDH